jgi:tRNA nucleotidyltransferase (CCA-adding enzyme)
VSAPERLRIALPPGLGRLLDALREAGGRPWLVGGAVRDALLGLPLVDYDVEVYGLKAPELSEVLGRVGRVDAVGQAFTVLKVSGLEGVAGAVDVALPRRDSKVERGHRGIAVRGDPHLEMVEAARRRDFTLNAVLWDPADAALVDPFGGAADLLEHRLLRAVDAGSFGEDPLRALRALQMAARFELRVEPATASLCRQMPIAELPAERVFGEIEKLLLRARRPSIGLALMREWGMLPVLAPELVPLAATEQDPEWHPEGDVWTHTLMVVDEAAKLIRDLERPRALTVMLGALCHDLGKPSTTVREDGRIRSRGHEEAGVGPTLALLARWNVHSLLGYDVRGQVVALVADHLKPGQLYHDRERVSDGAIRRLARRCEADLLYRVARADCLGRGGGFAPVAMEWFREKVRSLAVERRGPEPLLRGRDLLELGVEPGPRVGRLLAELYEAQLDGQIEDREAALAAAGRLVSRPQTVTREETR